MSFSTSDISNLGGPGSSAEPSMEEILASIRRILKEDDTAKTVPVDLDDDVLVLDQSMRARPADVGSVTHMPIEPPAAPLQSGPEPLHFSSEPTPFAKDFIPASEAPRAVYEPVVPERPAAPAVPPPAPAPPAYEPLPASTGYQPLIPDPPIGARAEYAAPAPPPVPEPPPPVAAAEPPPVYTPPPAPLPPEPPKLETKMPENAPENVEPPHSIISDKTTDAAASSIGALVRSMSTEKSVTVSRTGLTIEDMVREEIRPLLKSWLDTHLPSLVERVVRSEIERVIDRSGT